MSGGDGEENQKWPCNLCTYLNYQSAHRCTMCGSSRPVQQIIPTNQSSSFDTDPLPSAPSPPPRPHDSGGEKWACTRCTYLNYPRAIRCSQCSSQKNSCSVSPTDIRDDAFGAHSPPSQQTSRATMSPQSSSPTFKISLGSPTKVVHSPSHKARLSPPLKSRQSPPSKSRQSPSLKSRQSPPLKLHQSSPKGRRSPPRQGSPKQGPKTPNSKSRVNHETQTSPSGIPSPEQQCTLQHKWCCPACTYENWPRSVRCIMCTTPKTALSRDLDGSKHNVPVPPNGSYETSKSRLGCSGTTSTSESQTDAEFESTGNSAESQCIENHDLGNDVNTPNSRNQKSTEGSLALTDISKTCESINIINKNRSELVLEKQSNRQESSKSSSGKPSCINDASAIKSSDYTITTTASSPTHTAGSHSSSAGNKILFSTDPNNGCSCITSNEKDASLCKVNANEICVGASAVAVSGDAGVRGRANEGAIALNNYETERLLRQLRRRLRDADLAFLNACLAVVEGNYEPVERYLSAGGDPMRKLTSTDIKLLARPSAFDEGHTLVHLAIRFGREDLLDTILSGIHGGGCGAKRVPCFVAPELATDIRRSIAASLRQRREAFPCYCVSEFVTYSLPPEIEHLGSTSVQDRLWDELLDRDVQKQLEEDAPIINWSLELTERLGSRLYALWNRTAGDCLLDSVLQATWGVFDRDNCLRHALAASITDASHLLYPRWKEYERLQARMLDYAVPENQVLEEWAELVCLASQPGAALDQLHIFVLAHILRRPIIVYGVKCVKSFRGEDLGFARFEGVYLPFLWDASFCCKSPIALGYTRGHFCALVPICPQSLPASAAGAILDPGESQLVFLPLMSSDGKLLPVHFLSQAEVGCEAGLLREWLEVCQSDTGLLVAQQKLHKKPLPVAQMTEEWLNYYRTMAQMEGAPFARPVTTQNYSSDGDSEEE
ncbi:ubiquitin thioesterase trabid [Hyalella azteca]|uniref:ubiquitinyl hydrolase 1 n=1 Tax=Hyalella azteca TaxID=294128 RepID=A0A8B7NPM2_HYAAZ|nr:ubiquitin thioesterase trabid [Hyalella azteca]